jgi:hypothetical protein
MKRSSALASPSVRTSPSLMRRHNTSSAVCAHSCAMRYRIEGNAEVRIRPRAGGRRSGSSIYLSLPKQLRWGHGRRGGFITSGPDDRRPGRDRARTRLMQCRM